MPSSLLVALHARPKIRLEVFIPERYGKPMQHALLASPSLHKLDFTIFGFVYQKPCPSEFRTFKRLLGKGGGLKSLTLHVSDYGDKAPTVRPDLEEGELNFNFEPGDNFPALEELILDCYDRYYLSAAHCDIWTTCMNWSYLKNLDLGHATPQYLLPTLTGLVPQLKRLRFGFWRNAHRSNASWGSSQDLKVVINFVQSIKALEEIVLISWDDVQCTQIRPAIFTQHGDSLRTVEHDLDFRDSWNLGHFEELREKVSGLEELNVTIQMERVKPLPESLSRWPMSIQRTLCSLTSLQQLTLRIRLQQDTFELVPVERSWEESTIDDNAARRIVTALYNDFGANAAIETVTVSFLAVSPGQIVWTYKARKKWMSAGKCYIVVVERTIENEELDKRVRNAPFDPFAIGPIEGRF